MSEPCGSDEGWCGWCGTCREQTEHEQQSEYAHYDTDPSRFNCGYTEYQ